MKEKNNTTSSQNFSVLLSTFYKDSPEYLSLALESLVNQALPAAEVVFVEDGPLTKDLYTVLESYQMKLPLVRVPLKENKGLGFALNIGLEKCSYDIVIRMDADDICYRDRFKLQYEYLSNNPDVDILGGWAHDIDPQGNIISERKYPTSHDDIYRLMWTNPLIHPAVAFRKSKILSIGSYDPAVVRRQDYDLWIRAAVHGLRIENLPHFLIKYRFTDNYYKKNNTKVAFKQAVMGYKGVKQLKLPFYTKIAVFAPVLRSLLPVGLIGPVHRLMSKFDPRNKKL